MSSAHGALIVFGAGPGVGRGVAELFAQRGFVKIFLLSRNAENLKREADIVRSSGEGVTVEELSADLGDTANVKRALENMDKNLQGTPLECVLWNAARLGKSTFFEFPAETLEEDLRISVVSLYIAAQWAMPKLLGSSSMHSITPSLLVTSGMLAKDPFPGMFALATSKGGQYNLVHALHKEFEPKGVHCAVIIIGGTVADESKVTNPLNIAEEAWKLFTQPKGTGDMEVLLADPAYLEHTKNRENRD